MIIALLQTPVPLTLPVAALMTLSLAIGTPALAAATDDPHLKAPPFTVDVRVTPQQDLELKARPPTSHHFNIEAPISVTGADGKSSPAVLAKETEVRFRAPIPKQAADFTFSIYLCDDAKTFCERHRLVGHWAMPPAGSSAALASDWATLALSPASPGSAAASADAETPATATAKPALTKDAHGFQVGDADSALATAKAEGKPLLIDFFGIWCPPCNELDEEVFGSPEFKAAAAGFEKLKLDADTPSSWALKSRYKISGYPTVVLTSPDGDEIARIVGSRPRMEFVRRVKQAWDNRAEPYAALKTKADAGDLKACGRLGLMYLDRAEYDLASTYLTKAGDPATYGEALSAAHIGLLEGTPGASLVEAYEKSIHDHPATPESLERRTKLAELYESLKPADWQAKRSKILTDLVTSGEALSKKPETLVEHDMSLGDLWEIVADTQDSLGNTEAAKKAWKLGAAAYAAKIHSDKERGNSLEEAFCLWHSGNTAAAEALYRKLEKYYPAEFTYYFSHARMAFHLNQLDAAKELASQAYSHSYGDNRLRVAHLYAQVLSARGDKHEALTLINEALAAAELPSDPTIRTNRYADQLKSLQSELKSQN